MNYITYIALFNPSPQDWSLKHLNSAFKKY